MPDLYLSTGRLAGEEISSTYEGRHLSIEEDLITHPSHPADGFVDKGDPIIVGDRIVAVALLSALADTDYISLDTEGIWFLSVVSTNDEGNIAVTAGDEIFIHNTTCILSKITNIATHIPFGYALGDAANDGAAHIVAVKVHHDPTVDAQNKVFSTVATGQYGKALYGLLTAGGGTEALSCYFQGTISGVTTGGVYNVGNWINAAAGSTLSAGNIITPHDTGVYTAEAEGAARIVFGGQHQAQLNGAPASLHCWRLNSTQTITAVIAAANVGSVGYVAGAGVVAKVGSVPMFDIVGVGVVYAYLYGGTG